MGRHSIAPVILVLELILPAGVALAQDSLTFLPAQSIYPRYRADALAPQVSLGKITETREWIGEIGTAFPVAEATGDGWTAQVGAEASTFTRLIKTPGHITVSTIDYRIDIPLYIRVPFLLARLGYGHISNHYVDDGIELLHQHSISAVKDFLEAGLVRDIGLLHGKTYAQASYCYHNEPLRDRHWILQWGGDFGNYAIGPSWILYGAVDLKLKQEVNWGTTQSYQAGVMYAPREGVAMRIAYTVRTGFEERGQLFDRTATTSVLSWSIER